MASDISGPGGNFSFAGVIGHISAWSASLVLEDVETTGFAEVGNRTFDATTVMVTGGAVGTGQTLTVAGIISTTGLGASPTMSAYKGAVILTAASGCTWSFTGLITAVALNRPQNGKLDLAISFKSTSAITQAWT